MFLITLNIATSEQGLPQYFQRSAHTIKMYQSFNVSINVGAKMEFLNHKIWSIVPGSVYSLYIRNHFSSNTTHSTEVIWVETFQNEVMVEICSKSLVRAIGKLLRMSLSRTPIKTHKGDEKWPLFVNKQLFWWSASITVDNDNDVSTDL